MTFSGSDATGGLSQALAAVALAGVLLVLVLRRRVAGCWRWPLAAAGLGMIAIGALQTAPDAEAVRNRVRAGQPDRPVRAHRHAPGRGCTPSPGCWCSAAVRAAVSGAARWPSAATGSRGRSPPTAGAGGPDDDPSRVWKALDAGLDPDRRTAVEPRTDPDVHDASRTRHNGAPTVHDRRGSE